MDPVTGGSGGGGSSAYPDSVDSSPRSRGGDSCGDDPPFSSPKLRLMCSYGGRIVPRPTDRSLCYLGGDTRIVVVDRSSSLSDLSSRLSRSLLGGRPFALKYQLPNEDLDALISVTTDEDLENMIDEHDRIYSSSLSLDSSTTTANKKRLRLFLFPTKPESAPSSIGSLLDDSKSETWFVDALNGAINVGIDGLPRGVSADSASLLALEEDSSIHSRGPPAAAQPDPGPAIPRPDSSVPDSPMMETTSSFGSTSSAQAAAKAVPQEDVVPDPRYVNIDDHFAQMNLASAVATTQRLEEAPPKAPLPAVVVVAPPMQPNPLPTTPDSSRAAGVSVAEEDRVPDAAPLHAVPIPPITGRPIYYQEHMSMAVPATGNMIPETRREIPVGIQPVAESGYVLPPISAAPEQIHQYQQPLQQPQQAQQQFIHPSAHYVQVPTYYQVPHPMQQPQQFDPQMGRYYLPVCQNPQAPPAAAVPLPRMPPKTEPMTNIYRNAAPPAHMVQMAAGTPADQGQFYNTMGYHMIQQHHPSQVAPMANYGYANAVPANAATESVHQQMYYTQATPSPTVQVQYQTVATDEAKQNRGS